MTAGYKNSMHVVNLLKLCVRSMRNYEVGGALKGGTNPGMRIVSRCV